MKLYLVSLGAGILVGVVYSLLDVRSPAPPVVALIGLLGILIGEQLLPVAKHIISGHGLATAIDHANCRRHVMGALPSNSDDRACDVEGGDRR
ncbi:XapX domain-containing protein [Hyphomicrobium sp. CS1GBMeth3]|uniref:XapX domain-containing protein n=1 Tax=Hyphomicrobium sp. CS1GBMeth3 TaxID=1892845 RepID=UPI000931E6F9|nr:XapX domain-containing protein [Hyphomicrobium sp. CS1GBMeth3]